MTVLVAVDTIVTVIVGVLLVGVLRGYAEVLRALDRPDEDKARPRRALPYREEANDDAEEAIDVVGVTPSGNALQLSMQAGAPDTLLVFLSSGCLVCRDFFKALKNPEQALPAGMRAVIVTQGPDSESPAKLADLDPGSVPLVMSSETWEAYEVPGSPFFFLIDGQRGLIVGEGAAPSWEQLRSLLADAIADAELLSSQGRSDSALQVRRRQSNAERQRVIDQALAAAGIEPDDPTLLEPTVAGADDGPGPAVK